MIGPRWSAAVALFLLSGVPADAQPAAPPPYTLPNSAVETVQSAAGDAYRIMVAWPDGTPPAAGWPVLYVLDGEDNFAIAALTARRLARAGERSGVAAGVVVGIEAGTLARRVRDYTPATPGWTIRAGQPASGFATGGADAFLAMLDNHVRPLVAKRWRVDPSRETLLGHSFGGLLALHVALTRPAMFEAVVAVSPSLWFGDGLIAREATAAKRSARILIADGDGAGPPRPATDATATLVARLTAASADARLLPLPGQSHGSTMLAAMVPAIGFAFEEAKR